MEPEEPVLVAAAGAEEAEEAGEAEEAQEAEEAGGVNEEEEEPESPVVVPQPEKRQPQQQPQGMSEDDAEAARMMAETNAMIHQCVPTNFGSNHWLLVSSQIYSLTFCGVLFVRSMREDMVGFLAKNPEGTLANWTRTSDWSRDTGGECDQNGAPKRAQGGLWRTLFRKAQDEIAARPVDISTVLLGALAGRGLPLLWWLALVAVPGTPCAVR